MKRICLFFALAMCVCTASSCGEKFKSSLKSWIHLDPLRDTVTVTVVKDSVNIRDVDAGFILVNKEAMTVSLYNAKGEKELEYGIACGANFGHKRGEDDMRTPEGVFHVANIGNSTDWPYYDKKTHKTSYGCFGPKFIRLKEHPSIGIHGTNAPSSIGRRCSHGCIRVKSENILVLAARAYPGMTVIISPSSKDAIANVQAMQAGK